MHLGFILLKLLLFSYVYSREFGLFFQTENSYIQTSYLTVCDETVIKFEVLINDTSGVVFYADNKINGVTLIVYFERPGMYVNVTDGLVKYVLPLTLDFFSNQWDGWHEIEIRLYEQKMHLIFDSTERQIGLQGGHLFPEEVVEENEIYFGASPRWTKVGNVSRFSGFMRNFRFKSCGCEAWRPVKIVKTFDIITKFQGDCELPDACLRGCTCYLFPWGGKRCDCPREPCVQTSDQVAFKFDKSDLSSSQLQELNGSVWGTSQEGPFGKAMLIDGRISLQLFVVKGRTCFKNLFLCEHGFSETFWILPGVLQETRPKYLLIFKHSSNLGARHGLTVSRISDNIDVNLITRDGSSCSIRSYISLSVWSLISITYNQSHLNLYINSNLRNSSDRFIKINQDLSKFLSSTRFLFIGNKRDYANITISDWSFSTDLSLQGLPSIRELRFEQSKGHRKTNVNCRLLDDNWSVNLHDCYQLVFHGIKLSSFHITMVVNTSSEETVVLVQSTFINIEAKFSNKIIIEFDGLETHTVTLIRTVNQLNYIEIALTDTGQLTLVQLMHLVLLNVTMTTNGPFNVAKLRVNKDFNVLKKFRIINADRFIGARTRRILISDVMEQSANFDVPGDNQLLWKSLINGFIDQGLLLKHPTLHFSLDWFRGSCISYLSSCYHGLTISFWMKVFKGFEDVNDKYFSLLSSGKNGVSVMIETSELYVLVVTESGSMTKFIPNTPITSINSWFLIEVSFSQNSVPSLFISQQEVPRSDKIAWKLSNNCKNICIGEENSSDPSVAIGIDELRIWDSERDVLVSNDYISEGPSGHKLISFTNYQSNESFTLQGSATIIATKYGYALALNNFGPRFATVKLSNAPICFWNLNYCRRGILYRLRIRTDNLAISHQTVIANAFITVTINLEYLSVQIRLSDRTWFLICKDLLQLFSWYTVDISWHRSSGLKTYVNGKMNGYVRYGSEHTVVLPRITSSLSVGIDYPIQSHINYATILLDDIEIFEADRSNLIYETKSMDDSSCVAIFNFDDRSKYTISPALGVVGNAGLFRLQLPGVFSIAIPTCFNNPIAGCASCFTLRMWLNVHGLGIVVLTSGFVRVSLLDKEIKLEIGNIANNKFTMFTCQYDGNNLLNKWNFVEVSWDVDEGVLLFLNREGVMCDFLEGKERQIVTLFDVLEISKDFTGVVDEIELYHARISVLYSSRTLNESKVLKIIDKIKEKERLDKEVILMKEALESASVNKTVEIVDSFQVNGTNYVSYRLPKSAHTYIQGGREEVEISFKSFNSSQSSIIWVSDSMFAKNTLTLKNKKLYFTKVYIIPSSNTSKRLTEELEIHNNILTNVIYNVVINQRAGEIVTRTTSINESNIQSMIGRNPLLPMDSDVYFGGYNNVNFLKYNQISSSLTGIIYKARLKSGSSEKIVDVIQEMSTAKQNPHIGNYRNVNVIKKIIKPDEPQKASFLATLSYAKVPLMISSPFLSLSLPQWNFNLMPSIEIEFRTLESRGLLLFIGNKTDYISMEIFDSQLFFICKQKQSMKRLRIHAESLIVNDNKLYTVFIGHDLSGNIKIYFNRDEVMENVTKIEDFANSRSVIGHLGSYDRWPQEIMSRVGFIGCINFVRINDADYVNFSRKSILMKYDEINLYGDLYNQRLSSFKSGICEEPSGSACDNFPCGGGWCQLTTVSASGQLSNNNFKCNCLYSSKSLAMDFTGVSPLHNYNIWIFEYLLQQRSKACTEDTRQLVVVDQSFFDVTFLMPFPFISVLDLEFLILVLSPKSCIMDISSEQGHLSIIINKGQLLVNIEERNIILLSDVNLNDNQWHGLQIHVRLQLIRIKIGSIHKDFSSPLIPALRVSSIQIGNCSGYHNSHFKMKGLRFNGLNLLANVTAIEKNLFYSTRYYYPNLRSPLSDQSNAVTHHPVTFLNTFESSIAIRSLKITWFSKIDLSFSSLYPGSIFHISNGRHVLSLFLCHFNTLIFVHKDSLKKSSTEKVAIDSNNITLTLTIDLIRNVLKVKENKSGTDQILSFGIDSWNVDDEIILQFGVLTSSGGVADFIGFGQEDQQCVNDAARSSIMGCMDRFVWSNGNESLSFTDDWNGLMRTTPLGSVLIGQCKVVERCVADTCTNGRCTSVDHYKTNCDCTNTDFTGQRCHLLRDKCLKHICLNNGKCVSTKNYNGQDTIYCNCSGTGFRGKVCDQKMCPADFCAHDGKCYTFSNILFCDCSHTKYIGHRCEVLACKSTTCNGRGKCHIRSNVSAPVCECNRGIFGDYCEIESTGQCQPMCQNDGVCSQYHPVFKLCSNRYCGQSTKYQCDCDHTIYRGQLCDKVELGFHPIKDGVLLMENVTLLNDNYLRILFEIENYQNESTLVSIRRSLSDRLLLLLINGKLLVQLVNQRGTVLYSKVLGAVAKVNVLLLVERESRLDFYLNNKIRNVLLRDANLNRVNRNKRSISENRLSFPTILIGCNEELENCFDGIIAGIIWNYEPLADKRNSFISNARRYPVHDFQTRRFPKDVTLLIITKTPYNQVTLITLTVILIIALFTFYLSRRLWCRSVTVAKVYLNGTSKCVNNSRIVNDLPLTLDAASEIALIESKEMWHNYAIPNASPQLSSQDNYDSKLTVTSVSSIVCSEIEFCRVLLINDVDSIRKLNIIDYSPVPGNQLVLVINYLPEIKIFQNLYPIDAEDTLYKCVEINLSPCCHYVYCHATQIQSSQCEEFEIQAWKISNPYEILIRPPNILFTNSLPFSDDSYRIVLLNSATGKLTVFEMELGSILWTRSVTNCSPIYMDPLVLLAGTSSLVVNKELYFDVIDVNNGVLRNVCTPPLNGSFRRIVGADNNKLLILTNHFDFYHLDMESCVYDHKQLPVQVTIIAKCFSRNRTRIALGTETGEVYLSLDDEGIEYMTLGPRNDKEIMCVQFSMDGSLLAASFENNLVHIWRLESGVPLCHFHAVHDRGQVLDLRFTSDNRKLIVCVVTNGRRVCTTKTVMIIDTNYNYYYNN